VIVEVLVFGRDDRVAQVRRISSYEIDEAALGRELSQRLSVRGVHAGDGVRRVVVELGNQRKVAGIREHDPAEHTEERTTMNSAASPRGRQSG
jgi:hypothetical protein